MKRKRKLIRRLRPTPKPCFFCQAKTEPGWQDYAKLMEFLSPRARIMSREYSGLCRKHQRAVTKAIKQARFLGLMPFVVRVEK